MHHSKVNDTQFNYNSDMSGKVIITVDNQEMKVEGKDLIEFVLDRLRDEKIGQLEQMDEKQLKNAVLNAL